MVSKYHLQLTKKAREDYYKNPKVCLFCKKIIKVRDGQKPCQAVKKKFCNKSCSAKYNNGRKNRKAPIHCLECAIEIKRNRKYCSLKCQHVYQNKDYIQKWLQGKIDGSVGNGQLLSSAIRNYLLFFYDYKCQECGWNKIHPTTNKVPLHIDHMDGNYKNNVYKNLRVLCPNCHSLTHTYGSLNKGRGRDFKYKRELVAGSNPA